MTWRKWWALEIVLSIVMTMAAYPLPRINFWVLVGASVLLLPVYMKRVITGGKR
jgi:4-hydroxybenzoate polyprenyltransferase